MVALGLRHVVQDHLGIGGGLHHGAAAHQFAAQRQPVGEIAVMGDCKSAGIELGKQRLNVAQDGLAGGGITDMADGGIAGQPLDHLAPGKCIADEAQPSFGVEPAPVKRGDGSGFGMAENAEHAAFLAERVAFQIGVFQIEGAGIRLLRFGAVGRAFLAVHRASLLTGYHRTAGFSISFLRLSRAGLLYPSPDAGVAWSASVCSSSSLFFLNLFKMVFSGSSGKSAINQSPVPCRTTRDFAPVTQSGRCLSGTSQVKNRKATTTISKPRASPNRKPSVRSSAPIRESRIMSEILTVMTETTIRVPTKTPATTTRLATVSLLK